MEVVLAGDCTVDDSLCVVIGKRADHASVPHLFPCPRACPGIQRGRGAMTGTLPGTRRGATSRMVTCQGPEHRGERAQEMCSQGSPALVDGVELVHPEHLVLVVVAAVAVAVAGTVQCEPRWECPPSGANEAGLSQARLAHFFCSFPGTKTCLIKRVSLPDSLSEGCVVVCVSSPGD